MERKEILLKKYDAKFDILKWILSLMVLMLHTKLEALAMFPWLRLAVPLFFIMTSYFFFQKVQNADAEQARRHLKTFLLRNGKLYLFWFAVLSPITFFIRKQEYFFSGFWSGIWNFLRSLLFSSTFVSSWYLTAAVTGVLLIFFLSKYLKPSLVCVISAAAFVLVTVSSSYMFLLPADSFACRALEGIRSILGNPVHCFLAAMMWVYVGKCFAEKKIRQLPGPVKFVLLLLCAGCLFAEWFFVRQKSGAYRNDSYFMLLPVSILLFMWILSIKPLCWRWSQSVRRVSTVTYVSHGSVAFVIDGVCRKILHMESRLFVFFATLLCCVLVYAVIEVLLRRCKEKRILQLLRNAF